MTRHSNPPRSPSGFTALSPQPPARADGYGKRSVATPPTVSISSSFLSNRSADSLNATLRAPNGASKSMLYTPLRPSVPLVVSQIVGAYTTSFVAGSCVTFRSTTSPAPGGTCSWLYTNVTCHSTWPCRP